MGTADLKAKFKKASHEISMSTTQMAILMLFNEADELSFGDIQNATAMDPRALKKDLLSLACAKYKILKKDPKVRDTVAWCARVCKEEKGGGGERSRSRRPMLVFGLV